MVLISFREWLHSYKTLNAHDGITTFLPVLISFREWLHSYCKSFTERASNNLPLFSSLSESGFIPTEVSSRNVSAIAKFSSLSESGFIPTCDWLIGPVTGKQKFSSLSESGFIPTNRYCTNNIGNCGQVLISFREWLHSYFLSIPSKDLLDMLSSHLFQRVASFLLRLSSRSCFGTIQVLISFREWLHSYMLERFREELSEAGVLISFREWLHSYRCSKHTIRFVFRNVLISFREWLHSYFPVSKRPDWKYTRGSHLFQRVASFLRRLQKFYYRKGK